MIKLYQYELSPFCTKITLILNVKQVPYEVLEVPLSRSSSVKAYSPTSKLPTIEQDGVFVDDSTEIAYYLEEHYPDPPLVPGDKAAWARCHLYEDWADESLNFYMMKLRWLPQNRERWASELARNDKGLWRWLITRLVSKATLNILDKQGVGRKSESAALKDIDRHMQALSTELEDSHYLVENTLSLADISVYSQLKWMYENPEGKSIIDRYDAVTQWMQRVDLATRKAS